LRLCRFFPVAIFQRQFYHFQHIAHKMKLDALLYIDWNVFEILLIPGGKDDRFNSGAVSRQYFLFNPAYRQHSSTQGDFPRHGQILLDLPVG
jgi:hypothetical protein